MIKLKEHLSHTLFMYTSLSCCIYQ